MIAAIAFLILFIPPAFASADLGGVMLLPSGTYPPFVLPEKTKKTVEIKEFYLDPRVVTNEDFLRFVKKHPEWRKSKVPSLFADSHYLESWKSDLNFGKAEQKNKPLTRVSWFAAKAYCESQGKTLPTTDQWEYALYDQGRNQAQVKKKILAWYSKPNDVTLADAGTDAANGFGLHDMIGQVWEWTLDFNAFMTGDELRSDNKDNALFCGGASLGKASADDYAAFMRYSLRSSLKANYTTGNLGFRCAQEKK